MTETTAANPELLVDQVASLWVQPLEAASVVLSSGPRIFDTSGVLRIPKLVSGQLRRSFGEGGDVPDTANVDFDELTLCRPSARARMVSNPGQLPVDMTSGPFGHSVRGVFQGWTLAELFVLNRYRKRAI